MVTHSLSLTHTFTTHQLGWIVHVSEKCKLYSLSIDTVLIVNKIMFRRQTPIVLASGALTGYNSLC